MTAITLLNPIIDSEYSIVDLMESDFKALLDIQSYEIGRLTSEVELISDLLRLNDGDTEKVSTDLVRILDGSGLVKPDNNFLEEFEGFSGSVLAVDWHLMGSDLEHLVEYVIEQIKLMHYEINNLGEVLYIRI